MTIWGYSRAGGAGLLAGSLGALVSLGFFLGGQLILARILRTNPMISMGAAMAVYLVQILILFIIMAALKNASFFDPRGRRSPPLATSHRISTADALRSPGPPVNARHSLETAREVAGRPGS